MSAGRFLPETLGNRRHLHQAGPQHRLEAVSEIIVPFLEKLFLFWALNSESFEKKARLSAMSLVLLC